jgi:carbamoylphosphate synthase large subunit
MHVIFLEPAFPANQREFVRALHSVGATVTGIGDRPVHSLDNELKSWLSGYEQVPSTANTQAVVDAVRRIQARGPWVDKLECTIEALMYTAAEARQATNIPGLSVEQTTLCRDKRQMKQFLRARGIPCARIADVSTAAELVAFVEQVGFPIILKPVDGAGAHGTYKIDDVPGLQRVIAETGLHGRQRGLVAEEFISGHEGFYDTMTVDGRVVFESVAHYYPNVLEAMKTRWISPQVVVTNRIDAPGYGELRQFGRRVIHALQLGTTPTHMEWFAGDKGLYFSEIGARPPGCRTWDLYCHGNDMDLYVEWARAVVHGHTEPRPSRRFAVGLIALRPSQDGVYSGYSGIDEVRRRYGDNLLESYFPAIGSRTAEVGAGYLGHAWMRVRHPDYDRCREILDDIGRTVKVWAS